MVLVFEVDKRVILLAFGFHYGKSLTNFLVNGDVDLKDALSAECDASDSLAIYYFLHFLALETSMEGVLFILV